MKQPLCRKCVRKRATKGSTLCKECEKDPKTYETPNIEEGYQS